MRGAAFKQTGWDLEEPNLALRNFLAGLDIFITPSYDRFVNFSAT